MTRNKIAILLAAAGFAITAGSAYTAAIDATAGDAIIGSGNATITGGTASTITYTYNGAKTAITGISAEFTGDTTASTLYVIPTGGVGNTPVTCTTGALTLGGDTPYTCDTSGDAAGWPTAGLTNIRFTLTT